MTKFEKRQKRRSIVKVQKECEHNGLGRHKLFSGHRGSAMRFTAGQRKKARTLASTKT